MPKQGAGSKTLGVGSGSVAAGRPRDLRLDDAILAATRTLVIETGYIPLSLAAVAERAGTTTAAIYRRWSGKAELVHEAIFPTEASAPLRSTGDRSVDIRKMVDVASETFSRPEVRIALPGLIADTLANSELHTRMFGRLAERFFAGQGSAVDDAGQHDFPRLIEAIAGTAMFHVMARPGAVLDGEWKDAVTEMLVNGWRPET
jgi:AcrR family transcriptional regulator